MANVLLVLKMIPALIVAIKALEEALPGAGKGEQKLAALREILQQADATINDLWPTIEKAVGVLVQLLNRNGWK